PCAPVVSLTGLAPLIQCGALGRSRGRRDGARGVRPSSLGDVAQLGEHLVRNEGVGGSNPLISTRFDWARPTATRACEPRQDRKVAAVSNLSGVLLIPWPFALSGVSWPIALSPSSTAPRSSPT